MIRRLFEGVTDAIGLKTAVLWGGFFVAFLGSVYGFHLHRVTKAEERGRASCVSVIEVKALQSTLDQMKRQNALHEKANARLQADIQRAGREAEAARKDLENYEPVTSDRVGADLIKRLHNR